MVNRVGKGRDSRAWKTPTETPCGNITEGPDEVLFELCLLAVVADSRNYVIIIVAVQHLVDFYSKKDLGF